MTYKIVNKDYFQVHDEQEEAWKILADILDKNPNKTKLFVSDTEELQSYIMWLGMKMGLKVERTNKKTYME